MTLALTNHNTCDTALEPHDKELTNPNTHDARLEYHDKAPTMNDMAQTTNDMAQTCCANSRLADHVHMYKNFLQTIPRANISGGFNSCTHSKRRNLLVSNRQLWEFRACTCTVALFYTRWRVKMRAECVTMRKRSGNGSSLSQRMWICSIELRVFLTHSSPCRGFKEVPRSATNRAPWPP